MGRAQGCTVQLLGKTCCFLTGCGIIRHNNGYLLRAVLMLLCSIRIRWVQCALIFLTFSQPYLDVFLFLSSFLLLCLEYPLPLNFSPHHLAFSNHSYTSRLSLSVFVFRKPFFTSTLSVKPLQEPPYCPTFEMNPTHFYCDLHT